MGLRRKNFSTKKAGVDDVVVLAVNDEEFRCASKIPGMVLIDFISQMDQDDPKSATDTLNDLFKAALQYKEDAPGEYERFQAYCRVEDNDVDLDTLAEMAGWLAEQYSGGNPTQPYSGSSNGLPETGPSNLARPLEPVAT